MPEALIYIPDITGFTKFVNNTEIDHAQHIISELLEVIIDSNMLELSVSEVEGDAVLFYKTDELPSLEDLLRQSKETFIGFHQHLRKYETERVCNCGACSSAASLSLKFIAHTGEIGFTKVKNKVKPFGGPLVTAHRLLKNAINAPEYLLTTQKISEPQDSSFSWALFQEGKETYDDDEISYVFTPLADLHKEVTDPPPAPPPLRIKRPVVLSASFKKPLYLVFEMVNNLDFRLLWRKDLKELEYEKGKLNRQGTKHRCLFDGGFADFQTVKGDFGVDALVYGEQVHNPPLAKQVVLYYVLTEDHGITTLTTEGHFELPKWLGFLAPLVRHKLKKNFKALLEEFEEVINNTTAIEYPKDI